MLRKVLSFANQSPTCPYSYEEIATVLTRTILFSCLEDSIDSRSSGIMNIVESFPESDEAELSFGDQWLQNNRSIFLAKHMHKMVGYRLEYLF